MSGENESVRAFFALPLPEEARRAVAQVVSALRVLPDGDEVRWVGPASYHLTLRFLGNVDPSRIPALVARVGAQVQEFPSFEMTLHDPHLFPSPRRPRVVALEVRPTDRLAALAEAIEQGVVQAGFPGETRSFRAHLTLGRIRGRRFPRPAEVGPPRTAPISVREVVLLRSQLRREGASYTHLGHVPLAGVGAEISDSPPFPFSEGEDHGEERTQRF